MADEEQVPPKIKFHYLKGPQIVTVYADGAYGGITPKGMISMALYNERHPIPQEESAEISAEGRIVKTEKVKVRSGIVRQVDCAVYMTPEVAKGVGEWLIRHATTALELREEKADD